MQITIGSFELQSQPIILASRSPRRRELLQLLVPAERIEVVPPRDANETAFSDLHVVEAIERRVGDIARAKAADVTDQLARRPTGATAAGHPLVVAADTIIVVHDTDGRAVVLGQPPEDNTWPAIVRRWFREYYAGRAHLALTGVCVRIGDRLIERIVRTEVTFTSDVDRHLEWYLSSGESRGKAGGYAIQGAGSVFVTRIVGSLSNVVGLPLEALRDIFDEISGDVACRR